MMLALLITGYIRFLHKLYKVHTKYMANILLFSLSKHEIYIQMHKKVQKGIDLR